MRAEGTTDLRTHWAAEVRAARRATAFVSFSDAVDVVYGLQARDPPCAGVLTHNEPLFVHAVGPRP